MGLLYKFGLLAKRTTGETVSYRKRPTPLVLQHWTMLAPREWASWGRAVSWFTFFLFPREYGSF